MEWELQNLNTLDIPNYQCLIPSPKLIHPKYIRSRRPINHHTCNQEIITMHHKHHYHFIEGVQKVDHHITLHPIMITHVKSNFQANNYLINNIKRNISHISLNVVHKLTNANRQFNKIIIGSTSMDLMITIKWFVEPDHLQHIPPIWGLLASLLKSLQYPMWMNLR